MRLSIVVNKTGRAIVVDEATYSFNHTTLPFCEVIGVLFGLILLVSWLWVLLDCLKNERPGSPNQVIWGLLIVFTFVIGAALYAFLRRPERKRHHRR